MNFDQFLEKISVNSQYAVFTNANAWYIDTLVRNLLKSASIYEPDLKLGVFCTDDEGYAKARLLNFPYIARADFPDLDVSTLTGGTDSMTDAYTRLSFVKVKLCAKILERGITPLYLDPDMAFKKSGTIDNLLHYISCNNDFVCAGQPYYMNSNILIARPSDEMKELFAVTAADIENVVRTPYLHGDEDYFRPKLVCAHFPWRTLPINEYPAGCDAQKYLSTARMIHANCVNGLENKIKLLKECNAWFGSLLSPEFSPIALVRYPHFVEGGLFEDYFCLKSKLESVNSKQLKRKYINATWTNLYCNSFFKHATYDSAKLQHELDALPRDGKYFTVVQFDEGVKHHTLPPDTLVFGCSEGDEPIPLVYESKVMDDFARKRKNWDEKPILASFVGSLTHPVRAQLEAYIKELCLESTDSGRDYYFNICADQYELFLSITRNSKFCLAPRGFGRSSFRFYEALKLGSVPVYIWDDIEWLPFKDKINYSRLCISLRVDSLSQLDEILRAVTREQYDDMRAYYEEIKHLFTFSGMYDEILAKVFKQPK